ncbi:MAG: Hsp20/alpha crystallin family protein [Chloroflexi bacterium]|nr:Hsp20/alpha crystallin family protein [Chloroflexota bacterium]
MAVMRLERDLPRQPSELMPFNQAVNRRFRDSFFLPSLFEGWSNLGPNGGTNLWETGDAYILQLALPGLKPDSLQCTFQQRTVSIKGESALEAPADSKLVWQSFGGSAGMHVQIPGEVDPDAAAATYESGILTIHLPKAQHARTRTIQVAAT